MVTLYNPGSTAALVTIRTALTVGSGPWLRRSIPARVEVRIPVSSLTSASRVSAQIDATSAIVAGSEWQDGTPLPVVDVGCLTAANQWSIIGGLGGSSTSDSLSIFNSSARASPVSIRVQLGGGKATTLLSIVVPAHGRYSQSLAGRSAAGNAIIAVTSAQPVTVAHTVVDGSSVAVSPAAIVSGSP